MSEYDTALGYVHDVLRDLQSRQVVLTAPVAIVQDLASLGASAQPASSVKAVKELAFPRPDAAGALEAKPRHGTVLPTAPASAPAPAHGPRPVPILPPLPTLAPSPTAHGLGTKAERLEAWRKVILQAVPENNLAGIAHPHLLFGTGAAEAEVLFLGEAPEEGMPLTDDPLTTEAGGILMKMLSAMGLSMDEVYLAQTLRVRAEKRGRRSEHRQPTEAERQEGLQRLQELIAIIKPRVIVALGASALEALLGVTDPIGKIRSEWLDYRGTPLIATYHPAYLVRNQAASEKRKVWSDMLLVLEKLGRPVSEKQRGFFLPK